VLAIDGNSFAHHGQGRFQLKRRMSHFQRYFFQLNRTGKNLGVLTKNCAFMARWRGRPSKEGTFRPRFASRQRLPAGRHRLLFLNGSKPVQLAEALAA
jgi:hypothetical protein